ncbi:hypothetical protein FHG87_022655, partial [Trinorchestia longiramus]
AIGLNPGYLKLRKIKAAGNIGKTISNSSNRVYLGGDTLMLNLNTRDYDDNIDKPTEGAFVLHIFVNEALNKYCCRGAARGRQDGAGREKVTSGASLVLKTVSTNRSWTPTLAKCVPKGMIPKQKSQNRKGITCLKTQAYDLRGSYNWREVL